MFTIVIPTHDRPLLLHRTLESLVSQSFRDFTVIIVSDSLKYVPPYQDIMALPGRFFYVLRNGDEGPAESRNLGIAMASTDYVMFLDDDDTLAPSHLQSMFEAVAKSRPEIAFCDFVVAEEDRVVFPPKHIKSASISLADVTRDSVFVKNRIPNSCLLYSRSVLESVRFDPSLIVYEDWDFLLSCLTGRDFVHVPVNSVTIHKSYADGIENIRRGNSNDEKIIETNLILYKRHPAPNMNTRIARQQFFASAGVRLPIDSF